MCVWDFPQLLLTVQIIPSDKNQHKWHLHFVQCAQERCKVILRPKVTLLKHHVSRVLTKSYEHKASIPCRMLDRTRLSNSGPRVCCDALHVLEERLPVLALRWVWKHNMQLWSYKALPYSLSLYLEAIYIDCETQQGSEKESLCNMLSLTSPQYFPLSLL